MFYNIWISICTMFKYAKTAAIIKVIEAIIISIVTPLAVLYTQNLVDAISQYMYGENVFSNILKWGGFLIGSMLIKSSISLFTSFNNINMKRCLENEFAEDIIFKFNRIEYECFDDQETQNIIARVGNSPREIVMGIFIDALTIFSIMGSIVGVVVVFLQISWVVAVAFILILIVLIWFDYRSMKTMNTLYTNQTNDERFMDYYSKLLSNKDSVCELRLFSCTNYVKFLWDEKCRKVLRDRLRTTINSHKYYAIRCILVLIWLVYIFFSLINGTLQGNVTSGLFVALIGSAESLLNYTQNLSITFSNIANNSMLMTHFLEFKKLPETPKVEINHTLLSNVYTIEFDDVYFRYPNSEVDVLNGFSVKITSAQRVALIGENGSGKSTIIKLLCGLYKPYKGEIRVNNINLEEYSQKELQSMFSVVFQDFCNYQMTLKENIALGQICKIHDFDRVKCVAKKVKLDNLIAFDVPLGRLYDNSIDLSGGEWQKVAIARSLFSDCSFIILDEPTASLDPITESEMYTSFGQVLDNKGCLMISHRLASAKMTEKIIVVSGGKVVEEGTHEELIRKKGVYNDMWHEQSSWYQ